VIRQRLFAAGIQNKRFGPFQAAEKVILRPVSA
jgi:hypothetical protein